MLVSISLGTCPPAARDPKHNVKLDPKIPPKTATKGKLNPFKTPSVLFFDLRSPDFPFHSGHPKLPRVGRCLPKRPAGRSGPRRSSMCCRAFLALQPARAEIGGKEMGENSNSHGFWILYNSIYVHIHIHIHIYNMCVYNCVYI